MYGRGVSHAFRPLAPDVSEQARTHFFVTTFLPFTKLVDVLMRFMLPPPPWPLLKLEREEKPPPLIALKPPICCGENMSSISEKLKNGDICGCDVR